MQMISNEKNKKCPVCGKVYIKKLLDPVNGDHYYHNKEKLLGINHWPNPCVDKK